MPLAQDIPYAPDPEDLEGLRRSYEGTASELRTIVQFLSLAVETVSRQDLLAMLEHLGARTATRQPWTARALLAAVEHLEDAGLVQTESWGARCAPALLEIATREPASSGTLSELSTALQRAMPVHDHGLSARAFRSEGLGLRLMRLAFYSSDPRSFAEVLERHEYQFPTPPRACTPLALIAGTPFSPQWYDGIPKRLKARALTEVIRWQTDSLLAVPPGVLSAAAEEGRPSTHLAAADFLLLQGRTRQAGACLERCGDTPGAVARRAWLLSQTVPPDASLGRRIAEALDLAAGTSTGVRAERPVGGLPAVLACALAAIRNTAGTDVPGQLRLLLEQSCPTPGWLVAWNALRSLAGLPPETAEVPAGPEETPPARLGLLLSMQVPTAAPPGGIDPGGGLRVPLLHDRARRHGYGWLVEQGVAAPAPAAGPRHGPVEVVATSEERAVQGASITGPAGAGRDRRRLAWLVEPSSGTQLPWRITPLEQTLTRKGGWSRGHRLVLEHAGAAAGDAPFAMGESDLAIIQALGRDPAYLWGTGSRRANTAAALPLLAGHPAVYWQPASGGRRRHVQVAIAPPRVEVQLDGECFVLSVHPDPARLPLPVNCVCEGAHLNLVPVTPEQRELCAREAWPMLLPATDPGLLTRIVEEFSRSMEIRSHVELELRSSAWEYVTPDCTPCVQLKPEGQGLCVRVRVRPGDNASRLPFHPGQGPSLLVRHGGGRALAVQRDLAEELDRADELVHACETLPPRDDSWDWSLEDPGDCLAFLEQLRDHEGQVRLEWPEGTPVQITRAVGVGDAHVSMTRQRDWFAVDGTVVVDEDLTVRLKSLLRHAARSGSRFVPLGHGRFLALTDAFLTRLRDLAALCPEDHAGPALPSLAAPLAGELLEDFGSFERPDRWDEVLERARAAELAAPRVPADFSGTLRQYQEEGFAWLSKLAARGAGACLADDMGLGKTIQVLALLLDRATQGPGLVVAPTSLCINWIQEASRFTPALRFVPLAGAEDRAALIRTLGPGQVLVCTYGLLQNEQERLSAVDWGTAVLDEAQAIKNPRTKRARAAFRISARFRIAATGTPIENHLSELWSLFRYLNPLLLGTFERFSRVYARPIEQDRNVRVRERLRRVIQPFVLRRTKAEVLQELPERTEIVRRLEALPRERAFYEVLRREALERLAQVTPNARERNVQILAEMTRLRLACCNPGLITPEARVPSCKEEAFRELVLELLDNGHKALVFSQFVRHLTILRQVLDELGVHYQYLDGQTPAALRDQRVRAFQGGEGDLFLISLKAGGTGLNLTAADYVIHMDPWWNPAAEDQASDRAHRIGQERPVTIYRLVVRDTIEDRIVALHHDKRELAENLLAGTDVPRNVSPDEMIRLLGGAADDALASPDTES